MTRLVVVEGKPGSGKTHTSKYIESEFGFERQCFDELVTEQFRNTLGMPIGKIYRFGSYTGTGESFWEAFWHQRGKLPYTWDSAREVLLAHRDDIMSEAYGHTPEEQFHVSYVMWNEYLAARDSSLAQGKDVILDTLFGGDVRRNMFNGNLPPDIQKYLIRLYALNKTCIDRKAKADNWTLEKGQERISGRKWDYSVPDFPGVTFLELVNNTDKDWQNIRKRLKKEFGW
ncbi:MAG: hypothetical protein HY518_02820 [Candidatus Aenigmarchaeota archaeon]|nr:hypothetical protein [Candidatus Aenigmarchaeota archaeon]